jgi:hypothetical protein
MQEALVLRVLGESAVGLLSEAGLKTPRYSSPSIQVSASLTVLQKVWISYRPDSITISWTFG